MSSLIQKIEINKNSNVDDVFNKFVNLTAKYIIETVVDGSSELKKLQLFDNYLKTECKLTLTTIELLCGALLGLKYTNTTNIMTISVDNTLSLGNYKVVDLLKTLTFGSFTFMHRNSIFSDAIEYASDNINTTEDVDGYLDQLISEVSNYGN